MLGGPAQPILYMGTSLTGPQLELLISEARANLEDFIMTSDNPVYDIVSRQTQKIDVCENSALWCCEIVIGNSTETVLSSYKK